MVTGLTFVNHDGGKRAPRMGTNHGGVAKGITCVFMCVCVCVCVRETLCFQLKPQYDVQ